MKKHGVMLFTFVILFLTLGCDLAYGQGEEGNEKEEVIVTLNFSEKGAFGLKNNNENNSQSVQTNITFKVQDLSVSLNGNICYHEGKNTYLRLDWWDNNPGQINISVPKNDAIKSISITAKKDEYSKFTVSYMHNQKEISKEYDEKNGAAA